jgi:hypothetical protein
MRSALDQSLWQLALHDSGVEPTSTQLQFPISDTLEAFRKGAERRLPGLTTEHVALVESVQPFATGEGLASPLRHLRELSNVDKHRAIVVTAAAAESLHIGAVHGELAGLQVAAPWQPLKSGEIVVGLRLRPSATPLKDRAQQLRIEGGGRYYLTIEYPALALNIPATFVLHAIGVRVGEIVGRIHIAMGL